MSSLRNFLLCGKTEEERKEIISAREKELGVFLPRRTCPLKNGIGVLDDQENLCHAGCAWLVASADGARNCAGAGRLPTS
jgi:hypothetical protein